MDESKVDDGDGGDNGGGNDPAGGRQERMKCGSTADVIVKNQQQHQNVD
jgi:hypothetical protein